jgi:hypothetical protein
MNRVPNYPQDVTVYLVVNDFGQFGKAYVETDIAESDRNTIICNFISGQYSNALREDSRFVEQKVHRVVLQGTGVQVLRVNGSGSVKLFPFPSALVDSRCFATRK